MTVSAAAALSRGRRSDFIREMRGHVGRRLTITVVEVSDNPRVMKNLRQVFGRDAFFRRDGKSVRVRTSTRKSIRIPTVGERCDVVLTSELIGKLWRIDPCVHVEGLIGVRLRDIPTSEALAGSDRNAEPRRSRELNIERGEGFLRSLAAELFGIEVSWSIDGRASGKATERMRRPRLHGVPLPRLNSAVLRFSISIASRVEKILRSWQDQTISSYDRLSILPQRLPRSQLSARSHRLRRRSQAGDSAILGPKHAERERQDHGEQEATACVPVAEPLRAPSAALVGTNSPERTRVKLGILDTGIAGDDAGFQGRKVTCAKIQTSGDQRGSMKACKPHETDLSGMHGTIVAQRAATVAPNAELVVAIGLPERRVDEIFLAPAIDWLMSQGADVINMSLAITDINGYPTQRYLCKSLAQAIDDACQVDAKIVAATGNAPAGQNGGGHVGVPAVFSQAIAVGAYDQHGKFWERSGHGYDQGTFRPHFLAHGSHPSVRRPGRIETCTSYAAPIASGLIACALEQGVDPVMFLIGASDEVEIGAGKHLGKCRYLRS